MKDKIQLPFLLMYRAVQKTKIFRMSILMLKISFNRFCMSNPISSDLQTRGVGIIIEYWGITDKNHEVVTLSCHTCPAGPSGIEEVCHIPKLSATELIYIN